MLVTAKLGGVQTKEGNTARSMVGSEATALFEFFILPFAQQRMMPWIEPGSGRLEPGLENWVAWRAVCDKHARKMGLPKKQWLRVHVPLQFSVDRASTHKQLMMNVLRPRIPPVHEFWQLEEAGSDILWKEARDLVDTLPPSDRLSEECAAFVRQLSPSAWQSLRVNKPFSVRVEAVAPHFYAQARSDIDSVTAGVARIGSSKVKHARGFLRLLDRLMDPSFLPGIESEGARAQHKALEQKLGYRPDFRIRCWYLLADIKFDTRTIVNDTDELEHAKTLVKMVRPPPPSLCRAYTSVCKPYWYVKSMASDEHHVQANVCWEYSTQEYMKRTLHGYDEPIGNYGTWEDLVRAHQAASDHQWVCLMLPQFMPIGDKTPDIHQVAEMLVRVYKSACYTKMQELWADPANPALCKTETWREALQAKCSHRNESGWDRYAMRRSIAKMVPTCEILAGNQGERSEAHYTKDYQRKAEIEAGRELTAEELIALLDAPDHAEEYCGEVECTAGDWIPGGFWGC